MTIEQKCQKILNDNPCIEENIGWLWFQTWEWRGKPNLCGDGDDVTRHKINYLIKTADASECLTSSCEYIRECKKWFMETE